MTCIRLAPPILRQRTGPATPRAEAPWCSLLSQHHWCLQRYVIHLKSHLFNRLTYGIGDWQSENVTLPDNEPSNNQTLLNEAWGEFQVEDKGSFTFNIIKSVQSTDENINYVEVSSILIQWCRHGTNAMGAWMCRAICDYEILIRWIMAHYCWQMACIFVTMVQSTLSALPIGMHYT